MSTTQSFIITGGCGLQGSHIVEKLLQKYSGAPVAVVSRNPAQNRLPSVTYHQGDIAGDGLAGLFDAIRPTVVIHCAAAMVVGRAPISDDVVWNVNVKGTEKLLKEAERVGVKAFVYCSSASVVQVDEFRDIKNGNESMPTVQNDSKMNIYTRSKAEGERIVLAADKPGGMRTASLRVSSLFGERDNDLIPALMKATRNGQANRQIGDGTNLFDFTYAGNAADAFLLAAEKLISASEGVGGEAFFITDGSPRNMFEVSREVARLAGQPVDPKDIKIMSRPLALVIAYLMELIFWVKGGVPPLDRTKVKYCTMNRYYDISKARERLGYKPAVGWQDGMLRGVSWYLANEKKQGNAAV